MKINIKAFGKWIQNVNVSHTCKSIKILISILATKYMYTVYGVLQCIIFIICNKSKLHIFYKIKIFRELKVKPQASELSWIIYKWWYIDPSIYYYIEGYILKTSLIEIKRPVVKLNFDLKVIFKPMFSATFLSFFWRVTGISTITLLFINGQARRCANILVY